MESNNQVSPSKGAPAKFPLFVSITITHPFVQSLTNTQQPLTANSCRNIKFMHANEAQNNKTHDFIQENKSINISNFPKFSKFLYSLSLPNQTFPKIYLYQVALGEDFRTFISQGQLCSREPGQWLRK